jgi:drug/metabolite transporter (DMT)-like permease
MVSELICIFFYLPWKKKFSVPSSGEENKPIMPWYLAAIPVLFDLFATPLSMIGLSMVAASVYSMMRGMIVVFAAIMSILFLGAKYYRHHLLAVILIVMGIVLVGVGS